MKVTLQYFTSCPHWLLLDERLRQVIGENRLDVEVDYQLIESPDEAAAHTFHGSPSLVVDGRDPFATAETQVAFACRLYSTDDGSVVPAPSVDEIASVLLGGQLSP